MNKERDLSKKIFIRKYNNIKAIDIKFLSNTYLNRLIL